MEFPYTSINLKSQLYRQHHRLHPPLELAIPPTPHQPFQIFEPPNHYRAPRASDGLFYYLINRPEIGPRLNQKRRMFRMLICITVYSEEFSSLEKTLMGVYRNL